jgi:hypothetical protein
MNTQQAVQTEGDFMPMETWVQMDTEIIAAVEEISKRYRVRVDSITLDRPSEGDVLIVTDEAIADTTPEEEK